MLVVLSAATKSDKNVYISTHRDTERETEKKKKTRDMQNDHAMVFGLCLWQSNDDHIDIIIYHY